MRKPPGCCGLCIRNSLVHPLPVRAGGQPSRPGRSQEGHRAAAPAALVVTVREKSPDAGAFSQALEVTHREVRFDALHEQTGTIHYTRPVRGNKDALPGGAGGPESLRSSRPGKGSDRSPKGQKYTLLSHQENLSTDGRKALKTLLAANQRLNTAYLLKESFGQLWDYQREGWARRFFEHWRASLKWQRLPSYVKFAEMIDRHWDGIAAYCKPENKVSLGFVEGLNIKIRVIQRRAYGLRDGAYQVRPMPSPTELGLKMCETPPAPAYPPRPCFRR